MEGGGGGVEERGGKKGADGLAIAVPACGPLVSPHVCMLPASSLVLLDECVARMARALAGVQCPMSDVRVLVSRVCGLFLLPRHAWQAGRPWIQLAGVWGNV